MSRTPEQRLWDRLRKIAAGRLYTERIENVVGTGRPDLDTLVGGSFVPIELKQIERWPVRASTKVLGKKGVSRDQRNWHLSWRMWGGRSLIVVGVEHEVFTFNGASADHINDYNTEQFRAAAMLVGAEALIDMLVKLGERR